MHRKLVNYILLVFYIALIAIGKYNHELWRDEWHSVLLAKDTTNLSSFWQAMRYEGHPMLYVLLLKFFLLISCNINAIIFIHALAVIIAMAILLFQSPFSNFQKVLLVCNSFFLFEFGIMNRSYAFVFLFLMLLYLLIKKNKSKYFILILAVLSIHVHIVFSPIFFYLGLYPWLKKYEYNLFRYWRPMLLPSILLGISFVTALIIVAPPHDSMLYKPFSENFAMSKIFTIPGKVFFAFVHLPVFSKSADWNAIVDVSTLLKLVLLVPLAFFVYRQFKGKVLLALLSTFVLILLLLHTSNVWSIRHFSALYICVFTFYILYYKQRNVLANRIFILYLSLQAIYGIYFFIKDAQQDFSGAKAVVQHLNNADLQKLPIAMPNYYSTETISGYAKQPIYIIGRDNSYSFYTWTKSFDDDLSGKTYASIKNMASHCNNWIYISPVVLDTVVALRIIDSLGLKRKHIYSNQNTMVQDENFCVYEIEK